jgi:hypothetical protein
MTGIFSRNKICEKQMTLGGFDQSENRMGEGRGPGEPVANTVFQNGSYHI